jgi:ADP-ribosylglycohydrolase
MGSLDDQAGGMTAGCNPAHRCAPLAMAPFVPDEELAERALQEARLTHHHPLAGDVAAAVAVDRIG